MQGPLFKIIKNCKVVGAVHCTECGTLCGCTGPRITMMLSLLSLMLLDERRTEREPLPRAGYSLYYSADITQNVESSFRAVYFFPLTVLLDWNNGRTLQGKHNLCPQFLQPSGKYKCCHPESLLLSMEHLLHHGHDLPGCQGQHCRPDGQSKFLLKFQIRTEWFLNWIVELLWLHVWDILTLTRSAIITSHYNTSSLDSNL